jgi:ATP-GRASP peptide maturase of grasp-with-spasm system
MVVILSKGGHEMTTDEVIDWLFYFNCPFKRINGEDIELVPFQLNIGGKTSYFKNEMVEAINKASVIWYRRWFETVSMKYFAELESSISARYNIHIIGEVGIMSNFLFTKSNNPEKWLDYYPYTKINKSNVLKLAKLCKMNIPPSIITNNLDTVTSFLNEHISIITKPICEPLFLEYKQHLFLTHTKVITKQNINNLPRIFFPSFFQKNIIKKYEIRTFILGKELYSMAIFSQNDSMTIEDFRNYNTEKPNRFVPYLLPKDLEKKLLKLMSILKLNTGSVDLIFSEEDNKYYFLEVNPMGQFGMVSKPCNYYLEKEMAQYLTKK